MSLTVNSLTLASLVVSVLGTGLSSYLVARSWRRFHDRPSNERTWRFIASLALFVAFLALLTSVVGSVLVQQDLFGSDVAVAVRHLALLLRGGLLALTIALVYGWTRIPELNGNGGNG